MKRRKQIGKLIYTPRWGQGDVALGKDYDELTREEKLDVLAHWITELISVRNEMIPNPKSWHHFVGEKKWFGLTDEEYEDIRADCEFGKGSLRFKKIFNSIESKLKEKNSG